MIRLASLFTAILLSAGHSAAQSELFRFFDQHGKTHSSHSLSKYDELHFVYINRSCIEQISESRFRSTLAEYESKAKNSPTKALILLTDDPHSEREYYSRFDQIVLFDDLDILARRLKLSRFGDRVKVVGHSYDNQKVDRLPQAPLDQPVCVKKSTPADVQVSRAMTLFRTQCLECHMQTSHYDYFKDISSLVKWKSMSMKTIETFRMPPGGIDTELKHPIKGLLRRAEIKQVYQWLSSISPDDRQTDRTLKTMRSDISKQLSEEKKRTRTPVLRLHSKTPTVVAANQPDVERHSVVGGPLDSDYYIHSAIFENSSKAVHHTTLFSTSFVPGDVALNKSPKYIEEIKRNSQSVAATVDEKSTTALEYESNISFTHHIGHASNMATYDGRLRVKLPKGSYLSVNNHYPTSEADVSNRSTVLLFGEKGRTRETVVQMRTMQVGEFSIPKNRENYWVRFRVPVKQDILIHSFHAHMHYRGAEVGLKKISKDGALETLGSIPFFLFKHGIMPFFEKPIFIEKGSELILEARLDNSRYNISNPNSDVIVPHGLSIYDNEMCILFFTYTLPPAAQPKEGAESIVRKSSSEDFHSRRAD